nr:HAD-IIB family hydrolase [Clostridium thermarum]
MDKGTPLLDITIPEEEVRQVYRLARAAGVHVSLYKEDQWYIADMDQWAKQENEITNIEPTIINFDDLLDLWAKDKSGPNKILCMAEPASIKLLNNPLKDYLCNKLNIYPSKPTYLEIMPATASKTSVIELLCKKFNLSSSEVIAMGDNYNDINMIEYARLGVAMENAPEEVKRYAVYITLTNDEDGVAEAIKVHVLS